MRYDALCFRLHRLWCWLFHQKHHYLGRDHTIYIRRCRKCGYSFLVLICLAGASFAQPTNERTETLWRATHGNQFWEIRDTGATNPVLSGYYRSNSLTWRILPAPFDYRSNVLDTVMVREGKTNRFLLRYVRQEDDLKVKARFGDSEILFIKTP